MIKSANLNKGAKPLTAALHLK